MATLADPSLSGEREEKRIHALLSFVKELRHELPKLGDGQHPRNLAKEIENRIEDIRSCVLRGHQGREKLDEAGTALWNLCTRLKRDCDSAPPSIGKPLVLARVFASLVLALAKGPTSDGCHGLIRIAKTAIKAGGSCIEFGEHKFAHIALQKASDYTGMLQSLKDRLSDDEANISARLEAEYYILRTILSWKEDRLDVAERMYSKSESLRKQLDPTSAEELTDALFEIGKSLLQKNDFTMAVKWLERAYVFLGGQDLESLSREAIELQLAISQALVRAFLGLNTPESVKRAENHVAYLESEMGDKIVVLLLRLEIILRVPNEVFDSEAYANVLRRLVRSIVLSESTFSLIVKHIRTLDEKSPNLASQILDDFLITQVVPTQSGAWIGKAVLLRVSMLTGHECSLEDINGLRSIFDHIVSGAEKSLDIAIVRTILLTIWKHIDSNFSCGKFELCEGWCQLAAHSLLIECGPADAAKISRRLILCALEKNDIEGANEIFRSMSESAQNEPMTWYLAHKLALRSGDQDMASSSVEAVGASASKDPKFLYACCLDAQKSGDKLCLLKALKKLAEKFEFTKPGDVYFPALLRAMIRLQVALLNDEEQLHIDPATMVNDVCETFEGVVMLLQRDPLEQDGSKLFPVSELNWFSKNSYNLGVKYVNQWDLRCVARIFTSSLSIIKYYPRDLPSQEMDDLALRGMFCNFMISTAYIALGRAEDRIEVRLENYLNARKYIKGFDEELETRLVSMVDEFKLDLQSKLATLLAFDFEAAICLKSWDDLPVIVRKSGSCKDLQALQVMGDLILRAKTSPTQVLYSTIRAIINEIWQMERFDVNKLAKWLHCLLLAVVPDPQLSLQLIEETCGRVQQAAKTDKPFPSQELEWFVTTTFNHGVDYYDKREDELSKKWISHAFTLVHYHLDDGVLEKKLRDHYSRLEWD